MEVQETIARLTGEYLRELSQASSSSGSSCGRARRRHRQWHVPSWFPVSVLPTLCSRRSLAGLSFQAFWLVCMCAILVWLVTMHLVLCSLLASPGPDALRRGRFGPEGQYSSCSSSTIAVACARLVLLVIPHLALYFFPSCRQARCSASQLRGEILADIVPMVQSAENCGNSAVAVHQGRPHFLHGAEADSHVLATTEFPQLRVDTVVDALVLQVVQVVVFPVVAQRLIPMVFQTIDIPSCWTR